MYYNTYPTFDEIKEDLTKQDLIEIIEAAMTLHDGDIDAAIQDYVEAEYEPTKELDLDYAYDSYRDDQLTA